MKIKALNNFAHAPSRRSFVTNSEYEVSDSTAKEWIAAGLAADATPKADEPKDEKKKEPKTKGE